MTTLCTTTSPSNRFFCVRSRRSPASSPGITARTSILLHGEEDFRRMFPKRFIQRKTSVARRRRDSMKRIKPLLGPTYALLLLILFCCPDCHATLILTACSGNGVVIAADGLLLKPGQTPPSVTSCKIMQGAADCFFAASGVQDIHSIHYDIVPIGIRACKGPGGIEDRANAFEKAAFPEVRRYVKYIKAHEPISYSFMTKSGPARISVVFVGDHPFTVAIVQYVEDGPGNMVRDKGHVDVGSFVDSPSYQAVGARENAEIYHKQHSEIDKLDDVDFLRDMLLDPSELETAKPRRIGLPIAILKIDKNGPHWIESGACPAVKRQGQ